MQIRRAQVPGPGIIAVPMRLAYFSAQFWYGWSLSPPVVNGAGHPRQGPSPAAR